MNPSKPAPSLAWTGERMVPGLADPATEMFHWQRYLYFRPWYEGARLVDAASGEGYGASYASAFAKSVHGFDIDHEAVAHAKAHYPSPTFRTSDVSAVDYSKADLVVSFETIEHLADPTAFLRALKSCPGAIVVSTPNRDTHSPGNRLKDKPLNKHHTVEWTPAEFAELIAKEFEGRKIRFLSQAMRWPGTLTEGLREDAMYTIAVIGGGELPNWPRLGLSMATRSADRAIEAAMALSCYYPGEIEFAIVANGCVPSDLLKLRKFGAENPHLAHIVENRENRGFAAGVNQGLELLSHREAIDYFGTVNDDVYPAVDCLCELVSAFTNLREAGRNPGVVGPVSNNVAGFQSVDIGAYKSIREMQSRADARHRAKTGHVTDTPQIRGLLMLISPECLRAVGGFDPRFGLGNFEDDDHNIRTRLAGFSLWIAEGAFLHHQGSSTFKDLNIDHQASIQRNLGVILDKWQATDFERLLLTPELREGVNLFQPFADTGATSGFTATINGEPIDMVYQASRPSSPRMWRTSSRRGPERLAKLCSVSSSNVPRLRERFERPTC